ncbi:hypothetical protein QLG02_19735 [Aeromonas sp. V90_14]|uniref:hypothetical protein n=1 Tax=Aeromonas sp. V90_14 TaxID=3044241 RepID=UPI00249E543F|nr:hypothetical protein [Aeromonas sp. V90_14]MDI3432579.1 hypothetical protein [Aeromonas sp. V90_14]
MTSISSRLFIILMFLFSTYAHACGNNNNAIVQGPFRDISFNEGYICFQSTSDKNDIEFYLEYESPKGTQNVLIDTFYHSDAPVELMSVFFAPVNKERNVVILLRWNVNYESDGIEYPYFYEIKIYRKSKEGKYELNLSSETDDALSGYQIIKNGKKQNYSLDNAQKIKNYLMDNYGA